MVTKKGADKPADCYDLIEISVLSLSNITLISSHLKLKHVKAEGAGLHSMKSKPRILHF